MSKLKEQAYNSAMADYKAELILQEGRFTLSQNRGDTDGMADALKEMAATKVQMRQAEDIAVQDARAMQGGSMMPGTEDLSRHDAALCNKYRLSAKDLSAAKSWTANDLGKEFENDSRTSDERKIETYLRNKQRYQHMRATGELRDERDQR